MSRVSVIIPARDAGSFLGDALDSVRAQGLDDPEVVVVDDGSTDETARVARRYGHGVRLLEAPREGSGAARNRGLAATRHEVVAFLDADDLWEPEKSARMLPVLEADPGQALVFSDMQPFSAAGDLPETYFQSRGYDGRCTPSAVFLHDMISTPTVMLRRSCLERAGVFDASLPIGQDTDLWFRLALAFPFAVVDRPLVRRRLHPGNTTRDERLLARCTVEIWGRYLEACARREPHMRRRLQRDYAHKRWHHEFLEGCSMLREGRRPQARRHLARAVGVLPLRPRGWAFLAAACIPGSVRRRARR